MRKISTREPPVSAHGAATRAFLLFLVRRGGYSLLFNHILMVFPALSNASRHFSAECSWTNRQSAPQRMRRALREYSKIATTHLKASTAFSLAPRTASTSVSASVASNPGRVRRVNCLESDRRLNAMTRASTIATSRSFASTRTQSGLKARCARRVRVGAPTVRAVGADYHNHGEDRRGSNESFGGSTQHRTYAISPASQEASWKEHDDSYDFSDEDSDEDLVGEYKGAVLVRANGQKGLATTNRTNNGRIGGSWKKALGDLDSKSKSTVGSNGSNDATANGEDEIATGLRDEVQTVETVEEARRVLKILLDNVGTEDRPMYHACDTEVAYIDVSDQTPVGHGVVTCFSVFIGPDVNFAAPGESKRSLLWVDTLRGGDAVWDVFKEYFENPNVKKVWHNYSFDRHVVENHHGIKLAGFAADTMHMARLWNSNRKLDGGYSLEALSSSADAMSECAEMLGAGAEMMRAKRGMKKIFGKPKLKKDGTPGKTMILPPIEEIQEDPESRDRWIEYSALDAQATWFLRESLEAKLRGLSCEACPILTSKPGFRKCVTLWDFYTFYLAEFGELLTQMERNGLLVDKEHLANAERMAMEDKRKAEDYFRDWAAAKCEGAKLMNVGSGLQIRQLLFAGAKNKRRDKPGVELTREFTQESTEWTEWDANGREGKAPKKTMKVLLHGITTKPIQVQTYTATGLPAVSSVVLRALAGKPGAARAIMDNWDALPDEERTEEALKKACGTAFSAFGGGQEGVQACAAIDALNDVAAIDTLLSNFIIPLQGDDIRGPEGRVHGALNINTETGRLSARRPSLQNQPALEKDRYGIRKAFTAAPGNTLVVADYGQLELRLLAHMADCKSMQEAFEAGGDFHSRTALGMYSNIKDAIQKGEVVLEYGDQESGQDEADRPALVKDVFASERRKAKVLNFSIAYGKTAHGLAKDWGTSLEEAANTVDLWYADRPEVRDWQEVQKSLAVEKNLVRTLLGRVRNLPDASSKNEAFKSHALRASINTPIQGGAADIAMLAMLQIHRCPKLKALGYKLLMQIHDEVILEGPEEHKDAALALTKYHMENPFPGHVNLLNVALAVDGDYAKTWYEAK